MEVKVQDGDTINIPHGLKPIIKDTYITFKKQPIFKKCDVLTISSTQNDKKLYFYDYFFTDMIKDYHSDLFTYKFHFDFFDFKQ